MVATDLKDRWRTLQLLGPIFELIHRSATRANIDHHQYDLAQLSLRLIDYVVHNQASLEGAVSLDSVVDHLTQVARRMNPDDPDRPYIKVARLVVKAIFNDGRPHTASWLDADNYDGQVHEDEFRFRLLRMIDSEAGAAIAATDEAILLYLRALDTDLADQALALKLMVEIQMEAGEFDKALETAKQATRTAQGLSASLRERLTDTKRDIRAIDWDGAMPGWLKDNTVQLVDADCAFWRLLGLRMVLVVAAFGGPFQNFAFDHAWVSAQPACGVDSTLQCCDGMIP